MFWFLFSLPLHVGFVAALCGVLIVVLHPKVEGPKKGKLKGTLDQLPASPCHSWKNNSVLWRGGYRLVRLPPSDPRYAFVTKLIRERSTGSPDLLTAERIDCIQNRQTWQRFDRSRRACFPRFQEEWRFHGTPSTNVESICAHGLLTSYDVSGQGTTIWSALDPLVSLSYCRLSARAAAHVIKLQHAQSQTKDAKRKKKRSAEMALAVGSRQNVAVSKSQGHMFLCRVLVDRTGGQYHAGGQYSTVQRDDHIFPEFLITFSVPRAGLGSY